MHKSQLEVNVQSRNNNSSIDLTYHTHCYIEKLYDNLIYMRLIEGQ